MFRGNHRPTAAETVFLAVADLARAGWSEFDEAQITVAAWNRCPHTFGLGAYRDQHPDHKRAYVALIGKKGPLRIGLLERCRPNTYRLTPKGLAKLDELTKRAS